MRASGVYYQLTDASQQVAGSIALNALMFLKTEKGPIGEVITVTPKDYKDILGYNLNYNSNQYGLDKLMAKLQKLYVVRVNKDPYVSNVYFDNAGVKSSLASCKDYSELEALAPPPDTWAANKTPGLWNQPAFALTRHGGIQIKSFDALTSQDLIGYLYFLNAGPVDFELVSGTQFHNEDVLSSVTIVSTVGDMAVSSEINSDGSYTILQWNADDSELVSCGFLRAINETSYSLTFPDLYIPTGFSGDVDIDLTLTTTEAEVYKIAYAETTSPGVYSIVEEKELPAAVDGRIVVNFTDAIVSLPSTIPNYLTEGTYFEFEEGSNGEDPTISSLDLSILDYYDINIAIMNGIISLPLINKVAQKCETNLISLFFDAPAFTKYSDLASWQSNLYNTEYAQLDSVPDQEYLEEIGEFFVWPSVNTLLIYAEMFNRYGHINFPPAGYTYGNIVTTKLLKTDFHLYRDELKTNRMNYQWKGPNGPVRWEQRTRYATESDLSYSSTVFILRDLRARLITFMNNFNFRFTTPTDLLNIKTGLTTILSDFKTRYFLVDYSLEVPDYATAQESRENQILISVQVIKDGEVWDIGVELKNNLA